MDLVTADLGSEAQVTGASRKAVTRLSMADEKPRKARQYKLDGTDWRILAALQENARTTIGVLSQMVGLTPPSCINRIRVLEKKKFIRGYRAKLDAQKLDCGVVAFVSVSLCAQTEVGTRRFEKMIEDCPIVSECHAVSGEQDFVLKCVSSNITELQRLLTEKLVKYPGVKTIKTMIAMKPAKNEPGLPLPRLPTTPVGRPTALPYIDLTISA